ncbi:MAG: murein biosynthesis integral membrane protein MurJ [Atopobiaceae bacterium]|nr:murein biosynthesis integral membrane protein MurJ [Atopobiaceae bacterium]
MSRQEDAADESPNREATRPSRSSEEAKDAQVGRSTALMSALVIVSRLTGFLRTWGQAYALGVTVTASCYSVANNLPNSLYEIVIGGMLVTAFLPVYLSVKQRAGTKGASEYTSNLVSIVLVLMGAVTLLGFVFAEQVVWTQSFTAREDFDSALAVYFFRFFVIEVVLYALSSIFSGVLNAERDYFWSSAAPIFNNFVTTASFIAYAVLVPTNPKLALVLLALGNPLGVAVQVIVQMPSLRKHGIRLTPYINLRDPALKDTLSIGVASLVVMLCSFETASIMTSATLSVTAVGASVSYYARLWYTLPYSILAVPITTAMFTELSDSVSQGDMDSYRRGVSSGSSKIVFFMVPFAMYLVVFATPLIQLLAAGRFATDEIEMTATYLAALSVSLPAYGICTYLQKVCSSIRRMGLYATAHVVAAAIQTVVCMTLASRLGLWIVAFSTTIYMLAVDIVSFVSLRRTVGSMGLGSVLWAFVRATAFGLAGSAVGAAILHILPGCLDFIGSQTLVALICIVAGGVPALLVTFGLAFAFHAPEVSVIGNLAGRLLKRGGR